MLFGPGQAGFMLSKLRSGMRPGLVTYQRPFPPATNRRDGQEVRVTLFMYRHGTAEVVLYGCPTDATDIGRGDTLVPGTVVDVSIGGDAAFAPLLGAPSVVGALPPPADWKPDYSGTHINAMTTLPQSDMVIKDQKSPRRTLRMKFTCNKCGTCNVNSVNPIAWRRGTIFIQCGGCQVKHKLVDHLNIVHDMRGDVFPPLDADAVARLRSAMPERLLPQEE